VGPGGVGSVGEVAIISSILNSETYTIGLIIPAIMNRNISLLILILGFGMTQHAVAQDETRGTVIVTGWSQFKIVIATDSRSSPLVGIPRDDICKVITLDNRSVFTAAGSIDYNSFWNGFTEAPKAFAVAKKNLKPGKYLREAAIQWGKSIAKGFNEGLARDRTGTMTTVYDGRILNGIFVGFENGTIAMYQEEIMFDPSTQKAKRIDDEFQAYPTLHWGGMGHSETVNEILIGQTNLARREQRQWEKLKLSIDPRDQDAYWAIQLVKASMIYNPYRNEIGGPINALEITASGTRWIEKHTCK